MCGIIGVFGNENSVLLVKKGLNAMKERGRDGYGISDLIRSSFSKNIDKLILGESSNCIGHCLHSIVNVVQQPIDNKFIANCEIYNWKEFGLDVKNDSELLLQLIEKFRLAEALDKLDGVYAFAYIDKDILYLARDIIGEKPIWYAAKKDQFAFASEKKALEAMSYVDIDELNPRQIIKYNIKNNNIEFIQRKFFDIIPVNNKKLDDIQKQLKGLAINAISKRIPEQEFGILFSGGVDSVTIALICKQLGLEPVLYTAALDEPGMKKAEDLEWAEKTAERLGLKLKAAKIRLSKVPGYLKKIIPLIEDTNVVKVGVALPFYTACEMARKDGIKVIFSGLGSEEIFAGYERHLKSSDINRECLSGLLKMYERDLYRDDVITMNNNIELRLPFLDKSLVDYALKIPGKYKLDDKDKKIILRQISEQLGLIKEFALRKKRAAQYGSKFDKALERLAKQNGFKFKSEYLRQFYPTHNLRLGALFSSGKDSALALYIMLKRNYSINCLITIKSKNPDSYMFHTPNIDLAPLQAEAMEIPIIVQETEGKKEDELKDLEKAILKAKEKYKIEGIVTGALFSNYQRDRIEKICDKLGLKMFSPLWHKNQELEMKELINDGFGIVLSSIACDGLDKNWLGKKITLEDVDKLVKLNEKIGINIAGEGGEFESLVLDGPIFKKRLEIIDSEIVMENECTGKFIIKKVNLTKKH